MAIVGKILAKLKPTLQTDTDLYTAPGSTEAHVKLTAANQSDTLDQIRVGLVLNAGSIDWNTDSLIHDGDLDRDAPYEKNVVLATGEKIVVRSETGTTSFVATGLERT